MMKKLLIMWVVSIFCFSTISIGQNTTLDSLNLQLGRAEGTVKIDVLNQLMKAYLCKDNGQAKAYYIKIQKRLIVDEYPKGTVEALKNLGTLMYCKGNLDSALIVYQTAVDLALSYDFKYLAGAIANNMGGMSRMKGDLDKAITNFRLSYQIGIDIQDTVLILASLDGMGVIYKKKAVYDSALQNFLKVEKIASSKGLKSILLGAIINKSSIYLYERPKDLDKNDLLYALKLANELEDVINAASVYQLLGGLLFKDGKYAEALTYFKLGLEKLTNIGNNSVTVYLWQGMGNVYFKLGKYNQAIEANFTAINKADSAGIQAVLPLLYGNNASNYVKLQKYQVAVEYGLKAISYMTDSEQISENIDVYKSLAEAYEALGLHKKAYEALKEYSRSNNNYRDLSQTKRLTEMQVQYETEKKDSEIASLSQQATIQTLELRQKNQAILIAIILIAVIALIIYFIIRQKSLTKQRSRVELEQRFLRSQLNPHFISNALVAVQNFILNNQSEKAALYLAKFSKLMRKILENSRQEFIAVEDEVQMITDFLDIHKQRMNDSFDYSIDIDDNIDPEVDTIPPMFVQPFIENAVEHGISGKDQDGKIALTLIKTGDYITIEIKDNGGGLAPIENQQQEHKSLSTTIIRERMELFNKSLKTKIELIIENINGEDCKIEGSRVELKVPFGYI